jgi:hypothetical protein
VALQSRVAPYMVNPELQSELQPRYARILAVPEYYHEYRDTGNGLACFLGSSITAKVRYHFPSFITHLNRFFLAHLPRLQHEELCIEGRLRRARTTFDNRNDGGFTMTSRNFAFCSDTKTTISLGKQILWTHGCIYREFVCNIMFSEIQKYTSPLMRHCPPQN